MEFCLNCGKPLLKRRGKFCNSSCAATYNNLNRKTTTKGKTKISNCVKCGKEIEVSIHTNKSKIICNECSELKNIIDHTIKMLKIYLIVLKEQYLKLLKEQI